MTYKDQLLRPQWQRKRLSVMERDNFTCCICSDTETQLQVHHKKYINGNMAWEYEDKELQTLCKHCHKVAEDLKKKDCIPIIAYKKGYVDSESLAAFVIAQDSSGVIALHIYKVDENYVDLLVGMSKDVSEMNLELFAHAAKLLK